MKAVFVTRQRRCTQRICTSWRSWRACTCWLCVSGVCATHTWTVCSYKRTMEPFGTILSWQQWKHAGCADFFAEQEVLFRELYDDVSSTVQVAEALKVRCVAWVCVHMSLCCR